MVFPALAPGRILVVCEDKDFGLAFSALVGLNGYDMHTVYSARKALRILPEFSPHVVFCDLGMPDMSGYDLARIIRRDTSPRPFTASLSGSADAETIEASLAAGFHLHLKKTVSYNQVSSLLFDHFHGIGMAVDQRIDRRTAMLIDAIVKGLAANGLSHSARALYDAGVLRDAAIRVLTRPLERRRHPILAMTSKRSAR